jgi:hypothetical protein
VSESNSKPKQSVPLDVYAVALSLILALLVRFNWIPAVKW